MLIRISSGMHAPLECERAVYLLSNLFKKSYNAEEYSVNKSKFGDSKCYRSVMLKVSNDIEPIDGTVEWICKSPFRPNHKRKNWFIDVSSISDTDIINTECENDIIFETFKSGGNGGQNVNKLDTGVRGIHVPTGITFTSTKERSQLLNKKDVKEKIEKALKSINDENTAKASNEAWSETNKLVRGNPLMVFEGEDFKRKSTK